MTLEEPSFYAAMRAVMDSGSGKAREVRLGRFTADARTLVRDRDALAAEVTKLEGETAKTPKQLAAESREVPDGYELVAVIHEGWRVEAGKLCANRTSGVTCRKPSAAELNRQRWTRHGYVDAWYPYCAAHLYANWVEDGHVWHWILREKADVA